MEITGKIKEVKEVKVISEKFSCQAFILDLSTFDKYTDEKVENFGEFQVNNSIIKELEKYEKEDLIKVSFYIKGRFVVNKDTGEEFFVQTLTVFKIEKK